MDFIAYFLINAIRIYKYAILARILVSWMNVNPYENRVVRFLNDVTEPFLAIFRNLLPRAGMIDFSPILAFFALDLLQWGVVKFFSEWVIP